MFHLNVTPLPNVQLWSLPSQIQKIPGLDDSCLTQYSGRYTRYCSLRRWGSTWSML